MLSSTLGLATSDDHYGFLSMQFKDEQVHPPRGQELATLVWQSWKSVCGCRLSPQGAFPILGTSPPSLHYTDGNVIIFRPDPFVAQLGTCP
jgi:hypothetical protein